MRNKTRVLIADDSVLFRNYLRRCLDETGIVEVVGVARDGLNAIEKIKDLKPEFMTLDMEMPGLHGIDVLKRVRESYPDLKVVVIASETATSAETTMQALQLGAFDFVLKPKADDQSNTQTMSKLLAESVRNARSVSDVLRRKARPSGLMSKAPSAPSAPPVTTRAVSPASGKPDVLAIGSSTGGPSALHTVIDGLPEDFPLPVVITQHMPALFIRSLADRLNNASKLTCLVAEDGMPLQKGFVLIAPGDHHMLIEKKGMGLSIVLNDGPKVHHCKPAVDPMFESLAKIRDVNTLAVVLTGMGEDGAAGAKLIADHRGYVIAQDQATSVVWGMPGATVKLGAAHEVLPLNDIGSAIVRRGMPLRKAS